MMLRAAFVLLPVLVLAQEQAPPEVDQELRARVTGFYQNFLESSFSPRKAEPFVAEDTKDFFYNAGKEKYQSFQIVKITYSDNFTKAVVVVSAKMERMLAAQTILMDVPKDTRWKIENGKWCWTYNPTDIAPTPMGGKAPPLAVGAPLDTKTAGVIPKNGSPEAMRAAGLSVLNQQPMGLDKSTVTFNVDEVAGGQVVFTNGADGEVQIALDAPVVRGMTVKLDRTIVPAHGTAILTLHYDPSDKSAPNDAWIPKGSIPFRIYVSPFGRVFPLYIQFTAPK